MFFFSAARSHVHPELQQLMSKIGYDKFNRLQTNGRLSCIFANSASRKPMTSPPKFGLCTPYDDNAVIVRCQSFLPQHSKDRSHFGSSCGVGEQRVGMGDAELVPRAPAKPPFPPPTGRIARGTAASSPALSASPERRSPRKSRRAAAG